MRRSLLLVAVAIPLLPRVAAAACPTSCEVDRFLARAHALTADQRLQEGKQLFGRLALADGSCPKPSMQQDRWGIWLWEYALLRWATLFHEQGSSDILAVVDETSVDGGAGTSKCSHFYAQVQGARGFAAHYRIPSRRGYLQACWEEGKLAKILDGQTAPPAVLEQKSTVTACEADRLIDGLRRMKKDRRARAVEDMVTRAASSEHSDRAGTTYLYTRLAFRYRFHPDEAILAGFDAVATRSMTPGLCSFLMNAGGSGSFAGHYRQADRRPLLLQCATDDHHRRRIEWYLTR
jgi:hypothetical protein